MTVRLALALLLVGVAWLCWPPDLLAWTPGTHIYLGEAALARLHELPATVADLIRAYPLDFLYGNLAPDTSFAKAHAPQGRHSHSWPVGEEVRQRAPSDALRAFGLGFLAHLSADTIAHNYFVPRQLVLTAGAAGVGHSYWESRVEEHLGARYAREARELLQEGHRPADLLMDEVIAPTIFPVRFNRRLFRGMVHAADHPTWRRGMALAAARTRHPLTDALVEAHLDRSLVHMLEALGRHGGLVRSLDPAGAAPLAYAKRLRRHLLSAAAGRDRARRLEAAAEEHFALPPAPLATPPSTGEA